MIPRRNAGNLYTKCCYMWAKIDVCVLPFNKLFNGPLRAPMCVGLALRPNYILTNVLDRGGDNNDVILRRRLALDGISIKYKFMSRGGIKMRNIYYLRSDKCKTGILINILGNSLGVILSLIHI